MEFKKLVRILSVAAIGVWLFCLSFLVAYQVTEKQSQKYTTTQPQIVTNTPIPGYDNNTTQPTSPLPTDPITDVNATLPTQQAPQGDVTTQPTQAQQPASNIPSSTAEIVAAYVNGINTLKATPNFTCLRVSKLNVSIDKISGGSVVEKAANMVIEQNQIPPTTYTFINGVDAATGVTPMGILPPPNKQSIINEGFVKNATSAPTADGGYTLRIDLNDEAHIYPGQADNLVNIVEVVDTSALIPAQATTHYVEIYYSGVYVIANFDAQGRMTYTKNYMEVKEMRGSGSMIGFTMTVEGHGDFYGEYSITY
jgi:hypothetical protein